ncbi:hypothetical protein TrVFT333_000768 [Trichoderma virens FT-333]|nr:hypothetical protein TrVFT333_000768 [Trichoderma virens FT-333]
MGSITRDEDAPTASSHPLKIFDAARRQDRFLYACAPMLAFRQTVHKYGVDLCWTPMILAKEFNRNQFARDSVRRQRTLELARASTLVAPFASGVDLNCGCPQSWACAETLGAALMNKRELVRDMVIETRQHLERDGWGVRMEQDMENPKGRSVSVKIRVHDDLRRTMDYLDTVIGHPQNRLVDWVTIHPRTRHTPSTTPIRTEALEILTENNSATQQQPRPSTTNLSGFMSARGLLANPALFAGHSACPWETLETFMCNVARCPLPLKLVVHHVQEMCAPGMGDDKSSLLNKKERAKLVDFTNMADLIDFLDEKIEEHTGQKGMRRDL